MAGAETLDVAAHVEQNVIGMGANEAGINEGVQGIQVTLAGMTDQWWSAQGDIQGFDYKVDSIYAGDLFFSSLASECILNLTRLGVTEARGDMKVVLKYVSDLKRS
jgi:hypothetical protein